jgi:NADH:ubiquinone oxidoreductase subunit 5 (subunit L)/multisubunit Na+/H+ antiporter MnhA subunit
MKIIVKTVRLCATLCMWVDSWIIDGLGVNGLATFVRVLSYPARLFEWGQVQWYALVMIMSLVGCGAYYVWR